MLVLLLAGFGGLRFQFSTVLFILMLLLFILVLLLTHFGACDYSFPTCCSYYLLLPIVILVLLLRCLVITLELLAVFNFFFF